MSQRDFQSTTVVLNADGLKLALKWLLDRVDWSSVRPCDERSARLYCKVVNIGRATALSLHSPPPQQSVIDVVLGRLAQLVRAPFLHSGCRGFESLIAQ